MMVKRMWSAALIAVTLAAWPVAVAQAAPAADAASVQVVVDAPAAGSTLGGAVVLRGWAADPAAPRGTGVARVMVYRDSPADAGGVYLGEARYGLPRPDVARALGAERFAASGFVLPLVLPPGPHQLYVYAEAADGEGWSAPYALALQVGPASGFQVMAQSPAPALPPRHCAGVPAPFGAYPIETPHSYGAIYPPDVPLVFGDPWFWLTYGNPPAPAYVDFASGTVYLNSYFYQPRPARGIPLAC